MGDGIPGHCVSKTLVVVGHRNGRAPVGRSNARSRDTDGAWSIVVFGAERRPAYDRVAAVQLFRRC